MTHAGPEGGKGVVVAHTNFAFVRLIRRSVDLQGKIGAGEKAMWIVQWYLNIISRCRER